MTQPTKPGRFNAASVPGQPALAHWKAVENLMRSAYYMDPEDGETKPLNGHCPPGNGGYQRQTVQLKEGDTYDRYQGSVFNKAPNPITGKPDTDHVTGDVFDVKFGGNFVSPLGKAGTPDNPQSFESRALNMAVDQYPFKYTIEILKDVPTDAVYGELANVIPWYGQPGGGTQLDIRFPKNMKERNGNAKSGSGWKRKNLPKSSCSPRPTGSLRSYRAIRCGSCATIPKKQSKAV